MKVSILTGGVWHAFYVAEQLYLRGILSEIITGYPYFKLKKRRRSVPWEKIKSVPYPMIFQFLYRRLRLPASGKITYLSSIFFDILASTKIRNCDLLVGWPTFCLYSLRKAKSKGIVTVIDADHLSQKPFHIKNFQDLGRSSKSSIHTGNLVYQKQVLDEEYKHYSDKQESVSKRVVVQEWKEYIEADYLIVPTQYVYDTFLAEGVPEFKLVKIPYGFSPEDFEKPWVKEDNKFRILFGGSVSIRKGVQYILKAFSDLKLPNSELVMFGGIEPEAKKILRKYEGLFNYVGYIPRSNLYKLYKSSSIFVLPAVLEGFGLVILEAMGCGLPVIATVNTGAVEVIRDGMDGFIIPIRDVEALKEKILYLYEHEEERREMGRNALERAKEFTWDRYGDRMVEAYKRILKARRG